MLKRNATRILFPLCLMILLLSSAPAHAKKIEARLFPPGSQAPEVINAGLPASEYGYHPEDNSSYGESWYMLAVNDAGDQVWVLFSVSNYHPLHKYTGTVDLFYYPANGEKVTGHTEFSRKELKADLNRMQIDIGGNTIEGTHPTYRIQATSKRVGLDLIYQAQTPGFLLGQDRLFFGTDASQYWMVGVVAPRARVTGTVRIDGKSIPFSGRGYFDHGRSNIKVPAFSRWWYVLRVLEEDFSFGAMQIDFKEGYCPEKAPVIHLTLGDKVIVNSGALKLTASGAVTEPTSGVTYPDCFAVEYDDGTTKISGTIRLTRMVEPLNVLSQLSSFVRAVVRTLYVDPWQFRLAGEADLTLEHNGQVRKIIGPAISEVHHYK